MSPRDNDASTTQRRTMRPQRNGGAGHEPACLVVLQGQRLGQRIDLDENPLISTAESAAITAPLA